MLFTSTVFIFIFLPLVFFINLFLPDRLKNPFVLCASCLFYYYGEDRLIWLLLACILSNYLLGAILHKTPGKTARIAFLILSLLFNIGILSYFKYANFFVLEILMFDASTWQNIALPLGISFYIFQCISYIIDIYRKEITPAASLTIFGAYISAFPQLIAGPIVRYQEIEAYLKHRRLTINSVCEGCKRFAIGLGKKMLIANPCGWVADQIYPIPPDCLDAPHAWLAIFCYSLQIYYDFSGYSDMAIGLGRMIGFKYPENFDYPYSATSIRNFWRRWHMTLTEWLRDYVYIPLGGNRKSKPHAYLNRIIVFLICGLWHGASFNFIIWGIYHGSFIVLESFLAGKTILKLPLILRHLYTLLIVALGWVIFRAATLTDASGIILAAFGCNGSVDYPYGIGRFFRMDLILPMALGALGCLPTVPLLRKKFAAIIGGTWTEAIGYASILTILIISCAFSFAVDFNPFLYFRF